MKTEQFNIFTEKQLKAIKLIITKGSWGDTDMEFGKNQNTNYAFGYYTNINEGKEFSGVLSGISKTITSTGTTAIKICPDWWGDNSGDMMFFNLDLLECDENDLKKWASEGSQHTEGKWFAESANIMTNERLIANCIGNGVSITEEDKANVQRILTSINCHDELVDVLQKLLKSHSNLTGGLEYTDLENEAFNAIKKAKS